MRLGKLTLAIAVATAGLLCLAEEPKDKANKKAPAPKPVEAGRVYTQADLERVIQQAKEAPQTPLPAAPAPTPLPAAAAPKKKEKDEALSFSNEDLERMYGKAEPAPAEAGEPGTEPAAPRLGDPLSEVADWQAQITAATRARDEATARVKELEAAVKDLERRDLAVKNPYLARPEPPKGLEAGWDTLTGEGRAAAIDKRLAEMREELAKARAEAAKAAATVESTGAAARGESTGK